MAANAFTTGGTTTDRYTLNTVILNFDGVGNGQVEVSIHNASGSNPGTKIGNSLTGTKSSSGGDTTYTASGISLSGNTTYFVRVARASGDTGGHRFNVTASDTETITPPAATGWTIANDARWSTNSGTSWSALGSGRSIKFTVNATTAATVTLTVGNITQTEATLTIGNHTGSWWYKRTSPNRGTCTARSSSQTTESLSELAPNTSYTYRAYSNSACTAQIASVTFRTRDLAAPTNLRAEAGDGQVALSWNTVTAARGYRYKVWTGTGESERAVTNWVWFSGSYGDTSSGVVSGLTNGTTYTFRVHAMARGPATRYIQWVSGPESNPATATPVGSPGPCGGRLTGDGSVTGRWVTGGPGSTARGQRYACWFEFTLAERRRVSISLRSSEADPYLYLRSGTARSGTSVASNDDGGPGLNSRIVRTLDAGTYTIEATTFGPDDTGGFTLTLASQAEQERTPSESRCTQRLTGDGTVSGRWAAGCDSAARAGRHARWYEFTLAGRREVVIDLRSGAADSYLYLRSGAGERIGTAIASDDDGGRGYDSRIARTLGAGTYTIEATTYGSGETGGFTLTLSGTGQTAPEPPEETPPGGEPPPETPPATEPELRIFDARANEGSPYNSGEMHFRVTLAPAQSGSVGVCYQTRDGTARGDLYGRYGDYREASGCMYFAAGETTKYISVRLIGDWHDEGDETFFMVLENARGALIADGEAIGTIVNDGPLPAEWNGRFGRTAWQHTLAAVERRLRSARGPAARAAVAGRELNAEVAGPVAVEQEIAALAAWIKHGAAPARTMSGPELLSGSEFQAAAAAAPDGGVLTLWGQGAYGRFDGRVGELAVDGDVATGTLGVDWAAGPWMAGVALSHSSGWGGYRGAETSGGEVTGALTGAYPYVGFEAVPQRLALWAAGGYGAGGLTLTPAGVDPLRTRLDLAAGAAGVRATVVPASAAGGFSLGVNADGLLLRATSAAVTGLAAATADVHRVRVGLEGAYRAALGGGERLTPTVEVGVRRDGGDAESGFGMDVGGGLSYAHAGLGLSLALNGRALVVHETADVAEWGASGRLAWDPIPGSELGPALTVAPSIGASAAGGAAALWSRPTMAGLGGDGAGAHGSGRVDARFGYGLPLATGVGVPWAGVGLAEGEKGYRLGYAFHAGGGADLRIELVAARREPDDAEPEHTLSIESTMRW